MPCPLFSNTLLVSNLREVVLVPNRHWGGEGLLGCVFGFVLFILKWMNRIDVSLIAMDFFTASRHSLRTDHQELHFLSSTHMTALKSSSSLFPLTFRMVRAARRRIGAVRVISHILVPPATMKPCKHDDPLTTPSGAIQRRPPHAPGRLDDP